MAKRKKYTVAFIISNKLAAERIRKAWNVNDPSEDSKEFGNSFIIEQKGLSGIEVLKKTFYTASAIHTICCEENSCVPDNWIFALAVNDAIANLSNELGWNITGKEFDRMMKEFIEDESDNTTSEKDKTHIRVNFSDKYDKQLSLLIGYDWED